MLKIDFGLADEAIHVFFSGHRGYHIQVESNNVRMLNAMARKEIVDYVSGLGSTGSETAIAPGAIATAGWPPKSRGWPEA